MILSKHYLSGSVSAHVTSPQLSVFELPEKVLQFGTGVLLRGLPDYFIDKANREGVFNGRVAVVKSTGNGGISGFEDQDSLYTICVRGVVDGAVHQENIISSGISRVIDASKDWDEVLKLGASPELKIILSNTTEVGLVLVNERIDLNPPLSYPAKLLAVLYQRYQSLGDGADKLIVIATELVPENGQVLRRIVLDLIAYNSLENSFSEWMESHVTYCNSLVDRIVPGKPETSVLESTQEELGYKDELLIMAEPYRLWAIEGDQNVADLLGLVGTDSGVIVKSDIEIYRELKVRLLNGTHSLACGIAHLAGLDTVSNAMLNEPIRKYIETVMQKEIIPGIPYQVDRQVAIDFAKSVVDRFANPFIKHQWINITFQYTMKLKIRVVPVIKKYYETFGTVPEHIAFGFAAYLIFMMKGLAHVKNYTITDDQVAFFEALEQADSVHQTLSSEQLWGRDLTAFEGFEQSVQKYFDYITKHGVIAGLALLK